MSAHWALRHAAERVEDAHGCEAEALRYAGVGDWRFAAEEEHDALLYWIEAVDGLLRWASAEDER